MPPAAWRGRRCPASAACAVTTLVIGCTVATDSPNTTAPLWSQPGGWFTAPGANCFTSQQNGYFGAVAVARGMNPIHEHLTVEQCMDRCSMEPDCTAVLMQDTRDDHRPTCFLRRDVNIHYCSHDWSDFNMFLRPKGRVVKPRFGLEFRNHQWVTFPNVNCYPGRGADYVADGQDHLPGHLSLKDCETECLSKPNCEAMIWQDTRDGVRPTCRLRRNIVWSECTDGGGVFNMIVLHRGPWASSSSPPGVGLAPKRLFSAHASQVQSLAMKMSIWAMLGFGTCALMVALLTIFRIRKGSTRKGRGLISMDEDEGSEREPTKMENEI
eukprot:CAMPEP_0176076104 /NCGR_PEP_ID=MMETSP0120_2-20121206/38042_1 /TAXON_ID=160619 /ORGANISM="Kryptoperidinium foliaceum, Strain CCMP 1326" /LENGTH=324 /DNA_ID=CAMNT_0017409817 /DNA_START=15 /DNA_END=989 /DNA_ORIENTATION=+